MKRPTKQDPPTLERILDAASPLFYRRGVGSVTMDDVASAASLTKRTVYYHFPTKDELVVAYLNRWRDRIRATLNQAEPGAEPLDSILTGFKRLESEVARTGYRGCPFVNAVAELNDPAHPAASLAADYKEDRRRWFEQHLVAAGVDQAAKLSKQLALLWDGACVRALIDHSAAPVREARDAAVTLIESTRR